MRAVTLMLSLIDSNASVMLRWVYISGVQCVVVRDVISWAPVRYRRDTIDSHVTRDSAAASILIVLLLLPVVHRRQRSDDLQNSQVIHIHQQQAHNYI